MEVDDRSLTFPFQVEVFKVVAQGKVHLLHTLQLVFMTIWMSLVLGFSHFSPSKKSAASAAHPSPKVPTSVSSWTRAAYEASTLAPQLREWLVAQLVVAARRAAMSVLGTRRFSRRLTTRDAVVGASLQ